MRHGIIDRLASQNAKGAFISEETLMPEFHAIQQESKYNMPNGNALKIAAISTRHRRWSQCLPRHLLLAGHRQ